MVEDFAPLRGPLPQGLDVLALEGAHLVLLFARDLVGDIQMAHGVAAQIEGVDVGSGVFHPVRGGPVVAGRGDEMPVSGMDVELREAFEARERIGHGLAHPLPQAGENLAGQLQTAPAFEAFEKCAPPDPDVLAHGNVPEEIPSALEEHQAALDSEFQPDLVGQGRAPAPGAAIFEYPGKGLEEAVFHCRMGSERLGHGNFSAC